LGQFIPNSIITCPLYFFHANTVELPLNPTVRIRQITNTEKYATGDNPAQPNQKGRGWGLENGYETLFFVVDWLSTKMPQNDEITRACSSLLMFKPDAFCNELPWFDQADFGGAQYTHYTSLPSIDHNDVEQLKPAKSGMWLKYVLDVGEDTQFLKFWTLMMSADWPRNLTAAGRRLMRAQRRRGFDRDEDRLIDLIIGFEALVLNKNERRKQERMSSRFANLIGGSKRQQIEDDLGLAYDLRNDAVHDGYFDPQDLARIPAYPTPILTFIMHIEEYLRKGMIKYVNLNNSGQSKSQIITSL
jgi:hypothetical protein